MSFSRPNPNSVPAWNARMQAAAGHRPYRSGRPAFAAIDNGSRSVKGHVLGVDTERAGMARILIAPRDGGPYIDALVDRGNDDTIATAREDLASGACREWSILQHANSDPLLMCAH